LLIKLVMGGGYSFWVASFFCFRESTPRKYPFYFRIKIVKLVFISKTVWEGLNEKYFFLVKVFKELLKCFYTAKINASTPHFIDLSYQIMLFFQK